MSGRIFVHIGLPKTATTTLQSEFFPTLLGDDIHYLGVFQPRQQNEQNGFYRKFCEAASNSASCDEIRSALKSMQDAGETVLISEEMLTVSVNRASWREKLKNLAEVLRGLDYVLVLTVREPSAALFSYYVELNEQFGRFLRDERSFLEVAQRDEVMQVFHYGKLTDEIFKHFDKERLFVTKFEDVVTGNLEDLHRLITSGRQDWKGLDFKKHNEKKQVGNVVYTNKEVSLADLARGLVRSCGLKDARMIARAKKTLAPVIRGMNKVTVSKKKFIKPSQEEMRQLKSYLREETAALERHFGIRYE